MTQLAPGSSRSGPSAGSSPSGHHPASPGDRRGRHATSLGQGFDWLVGWSVLGVLLPGSGLIAAGRRQLGMAVLGVAGSFLAGLVALSLVTDPVALALRLAVNPTRLMIAVVLIALTAIAMVTVVIATHRALIALTRPTQRQRLISRFLVAALVAVVVIPAAKVGSYALIQRDLVGSVFATGPRDADAARPDVEKKDPWASTPRVNVLLLGSDAGADRTGVRTDTMILASINTKTGDTVMFSLPRNLEHVPFAAGTPGERAWPDGYYCDRPEDPCWLNSVWVWAEGPDGQQYYPRSRYPMPGLTATEDAIQGVLGLKVDYFAMLNLAGFASVVNALGGVTVNVRERLPIGGNSSNQRATGGWIEAGARQKLDGYQALWFARSRWSTDDYDRMRRQRCVVGAIVAQAQPANIAKAFPKLAAAAKNNISTSIQQEDLSAWADLTMRVKNGGSVRSLPFTRTVLGTTARPDYLKIKQLVQDALRPPTASTPLPTPSTSGQATPTPTPSPTFDPSERDANDSETPQKVDEVC